MPERSQQFFAVSLLSIVVAGVVFYLIWRIHLPVFGQSLVGPLIIAVVASLLPSVILLIRKKPKNG